MAKEEIFKAAQKAILEYNAKDAEDVAKAAIRQNHRLPTPRTFAIQHTRPDASSPWERRIVPADVGHRRRRVSRFNGLLRLGFELLIVVQCHRA